MKRSLLVLTLTALPFAASAQTSPQRVEDTVYAMFAKVPDEWKARQVLDETQKLCSERRSQPSAKEAEVIQAREAKTVVFPADGKMLGDWKTGFKVANTGTGLQFSDKADTYIGGNCYACHQMDPKELSYGTLGPSLVAYGKDRKGDAEAMKTAWGKIYNAQAQVACSMMPRFGAQKVLTEQQIKDVMAYLFDPDSPVNK